MANEGDTAYNALQRQVDSLTAARQELETEKEDLQYQVTFLELHASVLKNDASFLEFEISSLKTDVSHLKHELKRAEDNKLASCSQEEKKWGSTRTEEVAYSKQRFEIPNWLVAQGTKMVAPMTDQVKGTGRQTGIRLATADSENKDLQTKVNDLQRMLSDARIDQDTSRCHHEAQKAELNALKQDLTAFMSAQSNPQIETSCQQM